jgi:DUF971 family protein
MPPIEAPEREERSCDMADEAKIRATRRVGRYALGVDWEDGHESILPYAHLRAHCTCDLCGGKPPRPASQIELDSIERIGDSSVFLRWSDGHETLYLVPELRALCRCAYCIGEPERPITG